jgi:hypothetical protein
MWNSTPGEFFDVLAGAVERDRAANFMRAVTATSFGGGDPWRLLGEEAPFPLDPVEAEGWEKGTPEGDKAMRMAKAKRILELSDLDRADAYRQWLPERLRSNES